MSTVKNIIIQAGGRGSRLETLTLNKPKCLVPINNIPIIFYMFKKFPTANFKVIVDYKAEVLEKYLNTFAKYINFEVIKTDKKGTCSGIQESIFKLPEKEVFMIVWCDLILSDEFTFPHEPGNFMGISKDFECRWSYKNGLCIQEPSKTDGIAGLFIFKEPNVIRNIPEEGEFVKWLSTQTIDFERLDLTNSKEVGTMLSYYENATDKPKCRPFNRIDFKEDYIEKYPVTEQGKNIASDERNWYQTIMKYNYKHIPKVYNINPLKIERIDGQNIFEYQNLTIDQKKGILAKIIKILKELHSLDKPIKANNDDCILNYITKTFDRIKSVQDLIPFANDEFIKINGNILVL